MMIETLFDRGVRLRLLEGWLPLAQEVNATHGWAYGPATLQAVVLAALPALAQAHNATEARAILCSYQQLHANGSELPHP